MLSVVRWRDRLRRRYRKTAAVIVRRGLTRTRCLLQARKNRNNVMAKVVVIARILGDIPCRLANSSANSIVPTPIAAYRIKRQL